MLLVSSTVKAETPVEESARLWREIPAQMMLVYGSYYYCLGKQGHLTKKESVDMLAVIATEHLTKTQALNLMDDADLDKYVESMGGCYSFIKALEGKR